MTTLAMPALEERVAAGINDYPHFSEGWHGRSVDERCGIEFRPAMGHRGVLLLRRARGVRHLVVLYSAPCGLSRGPLRGHVEINGTRQSMELDADLWRILRVPLLDDEAEVLRIEFHMENPPVPNDLLGNGDSRPLGWSVSAAWQE